MQPGRYLSERLSPCRLFRGAEQYEDVDDTTRLTLLELFTCGCQVTHREYHDGCVGRTIVRHDGAVLLQELLIRQ